MTCSWKSFLSRSSWSPTGVGIRRESGLTSQMALNSQLKYYGIEISLLSQMNCVGLDHAFHLLYRVDSSYLLSWSCRSTQGEESTAKQRLRNFCSLQLTISSEDRTPKKRNGNGNRNGNSTFSECGNGNGTTRGCRLEKRNAFLILTNESIPCTWVIGR